MGNALNHVIFRPHPASYSKEKKNLHFIKTKHGSTICGYFINNYADITILFSHGNAEDIGDLIPQFENRLKRLKLNMFAYDYSGYGQSTGVPTETNIYNDVEAAYNYLTNDLNIPKDSIIAYGRSLGSAASVHIATKKELLGLILQSPLSSIHRVKLRLKFTLPYDLFCNIDKIHLIKCPILFIHGKKDKLISFKGTEEMIQKTKVNTYYMLIEEGGHNNLDSSFGYKVNDALISFIFVLKNNIRENVNCVYDISNINVNKLRNIFIVNNKQKLKDSIKKKVVNCSENRKLGSKKLENIKIINSSNSIGECYYNKNFSKIKSLDSINSSSKSLSTILASIESIIKTIPEATICENDNSYENSKSYDSYTSYCYRNNTVDKNYFAHYPFYNKWNQDIKNEVKNSTILRNNCSMENSLKNETANIDNINNCRNYDKTLKIKNDKLMNIPDAKLMNHSNRNSYKVEKMRKIKCHFQNIINDEKVNNLIKNAENNKNIFKVKNNLDNIYPGLSKTESTCHTSTSYISSDNTKLYEKSIFLKKNNSREDKSSSLLEIHNLKNHKNNIHCDEMKNKLCMNSILSSKKKDALSPGNTLKKTNSLVNNFYSNENVNHDIYKKTNNNDFKNHNINSLNNENKYNNSYRLSSTNVKSMPPVKSNNDILKGIKSESVLNMDTKNSNLDSNAKEINNKLVKVSNDININGISNNSSDSNKASNNINIIMNKNNSSDNNMLSINKIKNNINNANNRIKRDVIKRTHKNDVFNFISNEKNKSDTKNKSNTGYNINSTTNKKNIKDFCHKDKKMEYFKEYNIKKKLNTILSNKMSNNENEPTKKNKVFSEVVSSDCIDKYRSNTCARLTKCIPIKDHLSQEETKNIKNEANYNIVMKKGALVEEIEQMIIENVKTVSKNTSII